MPYEFLEHTADVQFVARAKTLEELFKEAALALLEVMKGNMSVLEQEERTFEVYGRDKETLLHDFLEEFIFLLDAHDYLCANIKKVSFNEEACSLNVTITGDKATHYRFTNDVKAITMNNMYVKQEEGQWTCQVVLDV